MMIRTVILPILGWLSGSIQTPETQRVPQHGPPASGQEARNADDRPDTTGNVIAPTPVRIVDEPLEAKHTQEREASADKHDEEDLTAQIRAADAAEKQISPAWWAVGASSFAAFLLIWNLVETRRTAKAAEGALAHAKETTAKELRPYLHMERIGPHREHPLDDRLSITIKNYGQTPAIDFSMSAGAAYRTTEPIVLGACEASNEIPPGGSATIIVPGETAGVELHGLIASSNIMVRFRLTYSDRFEGQHGRAETYYFVPQESLWVFHSSP